MPLRDSKVLSINSFLDWVKTCMFTSEGTFLSSIKDLTKSKSVCDAEGKPTSISLNPSSKAVVMMSSGNFSGIDLGSLFASY